MDLRDVLLAPFRAARALLKVAGRVTAGVAGVLIAGAGLLLIVNHATAAGVVVCTAGVFLTLWAVLSV